MTAKTFEIQVQDDHLERVAQTRKPVLALAEPFRNAVDADATHVDVTSERGRDHGRLTNHRRSRDHTILVDTRDDQSHLTTVQIRLDLPVAYP